MNVSPGTKPTTTAATSLVPNVAMAATKPKTMAATKPTAIPSLVPCVYGGYHAYGC